MPSKKVFIKRNRAFVHEQIRSEAAIEQLSQAKRGIGSFYVNKHSTRKGTGLTDEEVKLLLPQTLEVSVTDNEFRKRVELFYTEINTIVPYERGLELEIGLELDNEKPITYSETIDEPQKDQSIKKVEKKNTPINFEDYIRYRHALAFPYCAPTPDEAKGNSTKDFYIEDPEQTILDEVAKNEIKDKAMTVYQTLKTEPEKVKMVLSLLRFEIPRKPGEVIIVNNLSPDTRLLLLRDISIKKPAVFYKTATDSKLKNKYILEELITMGLLKKIGSSIIVENTGDPLGANIDEAVYNLFEDASNAQLLGKLKAEYQERRLLA